VVCSRFVHELLGSVEDTFVMNRNHASSSHVVCSLRSQDQMSLFVVPDEARLNIVGPDFCGVVLSLADSDFILSISD
jgi:hypothetical protein